MVLLDEPEQCHPLVHKVKKLVVDHIRRLGLDHLITAPSMLMPPYMEEGSLRHGKRVATADIANSKWED